MNSWKFVYNQTCWFLFWTTMNKKLYKVIAFIALISIFISIIWTFLIITFSNTGSNEIVGNETFTGSEKK